MMIIFKCTDLTTYVLLTELKPNNNFLSLITAKAALTVKFPSENTSEEV